MALAHTSDDYVERCDRTLVLRIRFQSMGDTIPQNLRVFIIELCDEAPFLEGCLEKLRLVGLAFGFRFGIRGFEFGSRCIKGVVREGRK